MPALNQYDYNELYSHRVIKNNKDYKLALKSLHKGAGR